MAKYLSGIQPTGKFHIGNYFGCIRQFISFKHEDWRKEKSIFLIADMHCYTKPEKVSNVSRFVIEAARSLLAAGVDPETTHIVQQSKVRSKYLKYVSVLDSTAFQFGMVSCLS